MRAVIIVQGGLIQDVFTDAPMEYIIIDQDVQDEDELATFRDTSGEEFEAAITEYETKGEPQIVEHYYNQIPAC